MKKSWALWFYGNTKSSERSHQASTSGADQWIVARPFAHDNIRHLGFWRYRSKIVTAYDNPLSEYTKSKNLGTFRCVLYFKAAVAQAIEHQVEPSKREHAIPPAIRCRHSTQTSRSTLRCFAVATTARKNKYWNQRLFCAIRQFKINVRSWNLPDTQWNYNLIRLNFTICTRSHDQVVRGNYGGRPKADRFGGGRSFREADDTDPTGRTPVVRIMSKQGTHRLTFSEMCDSCVKTGRNLSDCDQQIECRTCLVN